MVVNREIYLFTFIVENPGVQVSLCSKFFFGGGEGGQWETVCNSLRITFLLHVVFCSWNFFSEDFSWTPLKSSLICLSLRAFLPGITQSSFLCRQPNKI